MRAVIVGYGAEARGQAVRLRAGGWHVSVVVRSGGMSWVRAVADGFRPAPTAEAAAKADVVVVHLPDWEQPTFWAHGLAPYVAPGSLVVFAHGSALYADALDPDPTLDVVLVTGCEEGEGGERACRVAVHRDATGRALERAAAYARAAFGSPTIGTTTIQSEVQEDLRGLIAKYGGLPAVLAEWDRILANPGHEPDEATLQYYERTRATVLIVAQRQVTRSAPVSSVDLPLAAPARKRGAA